MRSTHRPVLLLPLFPLLFSLTTPLGINWGTSSSHSLPPSNMVAGLLRANNITKVKLADANADALESLSGTGISVIVGIPNEMLETLNSSKKAADSWVHDNVTRYFSGGGVGSGVRIEYIAIGDEPFLLSYGHQFQPFVIGAATNIQLALVTAKLTNKIKVIVPCSFDVFEYNSTYVLKSNSTVNSSSTIPLPSKGHFRNDLNKTITELLFFLEKQGSPFVVDFNPFSSFQQSKNLSIDYFLFHPKARAITDGRNKYNNFFDASIDTVVTSLSKAGFGEMEIIIGRIGWPTDGAINATSATAENFMKGLVDHLRSKDRKKHPFETYIFSILDEDQRSITTGNIERHWGLFTFDGQAKYNVDIGQGSKELVNAHNVDYLPSKWCVVNNNEDLSNVSASFMDACSNADCTALSPGGSCAGVGWPGNISYAFNSYYQQHDQRGDSCDFGGLGLITTVDPSIGNCRYAITLHTSFASDKGGRLVRWTMVLSVSTFLAFTWF